MPQSDPSTERRCAVDLESLLVSLYVLMDDWWQERHHGEAEGKRRPVRPASFSVSEVLTLAILSQWPR